jgi:hypothetical protein
MSKIKWYGDVCKFCKGPNEPYMVKHNLWNQIIPRTQRNIFVCLECFENKLGRQLTEEDFLDAPINKGEFGFHWKYWVNRKNYKDFLFKVLKSYPYRII